MKFGVVMHKTTQNIGDDIQTFAAKCHLPQVDYFIDREDLDGFVTPDGKPAAVIMSAWYMWKKWNWPPSEYVIPLLTGIHYAGDHQTNGQLGSPAKLEFLTGCGGEYMNAYGPVGCRDLVTLKSFTELGINSFFSGCITLTLPKMEIKKPEKEYICAADLPKSVYEKLKSLLDGTGIELIKTTHYFDYRQRDDTWDEREARVKELLTLYQNAKCVVTKRLHCALPCLAMGVPVFVTNSHERPASGRFDPYYDWLSHCTFKQFIAGDFDYDFTNPPPNSTEYLAVRDNMLKAIEDFVNKYKDEDGTPDQYKKTTYTAEQLYKWRSETMRECMNTWLPITISEKKELVIHRPKYEFYEKFKVQHKELKAQNKQLTKENKKLDKTLADYEAIKEENKKLSADSKKLDKENERLRKILSCRSVRFVIKLRNAFVPKNKRMKL